VGLWTARLDVTDCIGFENRDEWGSLIRDGRWTSPVRILDTQVQRRLN
jgi:hypothetical protein